MGTIHTIPTLILSILLTSCTEKDKTEKLSLYLGNWTEFDRLLQTEKDPIARDMTLLSLSVKHPKHAPELCQKITSEGALEKCRQVAGRPHLKDAR